MQNPSLLKSRVNVKWPATDANSASRMRSKPFLESERFGPTREINALMFFATKRRWTQRPLPNALARSAIKRK